MSFALKCSILALLQNVWLKWNKITVTSYVIILAARGANSLLYLIEIDENFHKQKKLMQKYTHVFTYAFFPQSVGGMMCCEFAFFSASSKKPVTLYLILFSSEKSLSLSLSLSHFTLA